MATKELFYEVARKVDDATGLGTRHKIGADFANVIDSRNGYTLAQFFDSYLSFLKESNFVYTGSTQPVNSHVSLWIDTGHTNQDNLT